MARSGRNPKATRTAFGPGSPITEFAIRCWQGASLDLISRASAWLTVVSGCLEGAGAVVLEICFTLAPLRPLSPLAIRGAFPFARRALAGFNLREHVAARSTPSFGGFFDASSALCEAISTGATAFAYEHGTHGVARIPFGPISE